MKCRLRSEMPSHAGSRRSSRPTRADPACAVRGTSANVESTDHPCLGDSKEGSSFESPYPGRNRKPEKQQAPGRATPRVPVAPVVSTMP